MAKIERDKEKIHSYNKLKDEIFKIRNEGSHTVEFLNKLTDLLGLNPEFYTIWNIRRETLLSLFHQHQLDSQSTLEDELKFVMVLMKRYPKCYWIWNHRLWCLFQLGKDANWEFELGIVSKLLSMDERNFHGWQYRRVVIENLETHDDLENLKINLQEFKFTSSKVNSNILNFSAWHNRSKLIPKVYHLVGKLNYQDEPLFQSKESLLLHELTLVNTGMYVDIDDSSIWVYLEWLLSDCFFIDELSNDKYHDILNDQLKIINELNDLEITDNGKDNCWCLKAMIIINELLDNRSAVRPLLEKLIDIDPLRRGRYIDQLDSF